MTPAGTEDTFYCLRIRAGTQTVIKLASVKRLKGFYVHLCVRRGSCVLKPDFMFLWLSTGFMDAECDVPAPGIQWRLPNSSKD